VSEAASRLTVKVKLHPAALPPETDTPAVQPAPWSKTRIALASLVLVGAGVAGYQFLLRPAVPVKPAIATEPERAALQGAAVGSPSLSTGAEQVDTAISPPVTAEAQREVDTAPAAAAPLPEESAQSKLATVATQTSVAETPAEQNNGAQPEQTATMSPTPDKVTAETGTPQPALPDGFSRIVLTDQMNNLQPGKAVGQQIPYPRITRLYLFTELKGYAGQILRHRWYFGDTLHTDALLTIEDSPWRTYSENWLLDDQRGPWRVEIVDQTQKVIFQYSFTYQ